MPTPSAPNAAQPGHPPIPAPELPVFHELRAPSDWSTIDFISDLHLQESEPANFSAWQRYLETTPADAVFILGDLFELWVGDDVMGQEGHSFETRCRHVLHHCAVDTALYFMHGNRDFLVGNVFLQSCGVHALQDPTVLVFGRQRFLLSHGDALCLADTDYQQFRAQVRSHAWQTAFLARPLDERLQMARDMRAQSEARKQQGGPWVDVDPIETQRWMDASGAHHMVHGHTHEGKDHPLTSAQSLGAQPGTRHVLCDWQADATPPRAQVLRLSSVHGEQASVQRLPV
jgi:UDP-2,3-diacylglucosamine hydrolase